MDQTDLKWFKMVQKDSKQDQSGTNWFNENIKIFEIWRKSKMTKLIVKNLINILNCINKLLLDFLSWRDLTFSLLRFQNCKLGKIERLKWPDFTFGLPRFHGGPARFSILDGEFPHVRRRDSTFYNAKFMWPDLKFYMLRRDWTNCFFARWFVKTRLVERHRIIIGEIWLFKSHFECSQPLLFQ